MNKIYGLNLDALRLCYEVADPHNINIIKDKEVGGEIDFMLWRANLCATFLGNLVYPTPASKMLHFP